MALRPTTLKGAPPWVSKSSSSKNKWKAHIKEHKGSSFTYTSSGWDTSLFMTSESSISVDVDEEENVTCTERGCLDMQFGCHPSTRSEYHFHEHVVKYHFPQKKTISGMPVVKKRTLELSKFGFSVKKRPKANLEVGIQRENRKHIVPTPPSTQYVLILLLLNPVVY